MCHSYLEGYIFKIFLKLQEGYKKIKQLSYSSILFWSQQVWGTITEVSVGTNWPRFYTFILEGVFLRTAGQFSVHKRKTKEDLIFSIFMCPGAREEKAASEPLVALTPGSD